MGCVNYYKENRTKLLEYSKEYTRKQIELDPEGYKKKWKITNKRWYDKNKEANAKRCKKWRQTEKGKKLTLENIKRYQEKNSEKVKCWGKGQGLKKQPCEICGEKNVHAHHDNYNKPLEVRWLCSFHHKQHHINIAQN